MKQVTTVLAAYSAVAATDIFIAGSANDEANGDRGDGFVRRLKGVVQKDATKARQKRT